MGDANIGIYNVFLRGLKPNLVVFLSFEWLSKQRDIKWRDQNPSYLSSHRPPGLRTAGLSADFTNDSDVAILQKNKNSWLRGIMQRQVRPCWVNVGFLSFLLGISSAASLFVLFYRLLTPALWESERVSQSASQNSKLARKYIFLSSRNAPKISTMAHSFSIYYHFDFDLLWFWSLYHHIKPVPNI